MNEYVKIFNGYRHAYGIADWSNATVDPESGKKKPDYRWTYEEFTDQIYQDHLTGDKSVGAQPTNENGDANDCKVQRPHRRALALCFGGLRAAFGFRACAARRCHPSGSVAISSLTRRSS